MVSPVTVTGDVVPVALTPPAPAVPTVQVAVKSRMTLPPLLGGAVKAMAALPLPAVLVLIAGVPGTAAVMLKLWVTVAAALKSILPDWLATMVQEPMVRKLTPDPLTVHTVGVVEVKATAKAEDALAARVSVEAASGCELMAPKVMVWARLATVSVKLWVPFAMAPLAAVMVSG